MAQKLHKVLSANEVRLRFLDYFKSKGHSFVPSTSVLCGTGHGTYFTNAGMNQFRGIFEADNLPSNHPMASIKKAVNSQRCIRMNDLGDVGRDGYHHTLFEMLGTWVFGLENKKSSAFSRVSGKKEAIHAAWDLLINIYGIDKNRLIVTYFGGESALGLKPDGETRELWLELGVPPEKVLPADSENNFWTMGEMGGPCGPCTEIHYLTGAPSNGPWPAMLELWNIVFITFSKEIGGNTRRLPRSHIDTGLGLERLTAVLSGGRSNYESDIFSSIFKEIGSLYKLPAYSDVYQGENDLNFTYRVLADHARMAAVSISDGVLPSNRDLGHKVRTVLTRAFGQIVASQEEALANLHKTFPLLAKAVLENSPIAAAFPELTSRLPAVTYALENEAHRFVSAWNSGKRALHNMRNQLNFEEPKGNLNPEIALRLLDGSVPSMSMELLVALAKNVQLNVDVNAVKHLLAKVQAAKQGAASQHTRVGTDTKNLPKNVMETIRAQKIRPTSDEPQYIYSKADTSSPHLPLYQFPPCEASVLAVIPTEGDKSWVVLDRTNLHPSNLGGQATDFGFIEVKGNPSRYIVRTVQQVGAHGEAYILHLVEAPVDAIACGDKVNVYVDEDRRQAIMRAHTACHLTMAAVRNVAKEHDSSNIFVSGTAQAGSAVEADRFTVDIQTPLHLTDVELIAKAQTHLNSWTRKDTGYCVETSVVPAEEAFKNQEIVRLPNEEYPPLVRVVKIGGMVSQELCCGTHVAQTSDIGAAVILSASGGRQGVKRFSVITGPPAMAAMNEGRRTLEMLTSLVERLNSSKEMKASELNETLQNLAALRRCVDSTSLPRVVRDQVASEVEGLTKLAIAKSCGYVEQVFSSNESASAVIVAPLAWRSLRTETTRSIIRGVANKFVQKQASKHRVPVIFVDSPSELLTDRPSWVICALPHSPPDRKVLEPIVKEFRLRVDEKKDQKWVLADGAVLKFSLQDFESSVERLYLSFSGDQNAKKQ